MQKKCARFPEMVDFREFARLLRLDENNASAQHLFKINDKVPIHSNITKAKITNSRYV